MPESGRSSAVAGGLFVVSFVAGVALVGDLAGSFADSDETFVAHFASASQRAADLVGSLLLFVSAMALLVFALLISAASDDAQEREAVSAVVARASGTLAAVGLFVAALSFATVPASISFGDLFDDPGIGVGQAVIPQFGYVALVGAMLSAAVMIVAASQFQRLPSWLVRLGYVLAALLALGSVTVAGTILLAVWVGLVSVMTWRATDAPAQ